MSTDNTRARTTAYCLLIGFSLAAGWCIPAFYDWTDSDQSRPSALLWQVPAGLAVVSVVLCGLLPWLPIPPPQTQLEHRAELRFGTQTLLIATALIAIAIPLGIAFPLAVSGLVCAAAFGFLIWQAVRDPACRLPSITLCACMILPFAWVVGYEELDRLLPALPMFLAAMPTFILGGWIGQILGQHHQEVLWVAYLLTSIEILVGAWLIRGGPKRTMVYLLFVMQMSLLNSLVFLQLCLA